MDNDENASSVSKVKKDVTEKMPKPIPTLRMALSEDSRVSGDVFLPHRRSGHAEEEFVTVKVICESETDDDENSISTRNKLIITNESMNMPANVSLLYLQLSVIDGLVSDLLVYMQTGCITYSIG